MCSKRGIGRNIMMRRNSGNFQGIGTQGSRRNKEKLDRKQEKAGRGGRRAG